MPEIPYFPSIPKQKRKSDSSIAKDVSGQLVAFEPMTMISPVGPRDC